MLGGREPQSFVCKKKKGKKSVHISLQSFSFQGERKGGIFAGNLGKEEKYETENVR